MPIYIKSVSFESSGKFNAKKDDKEVNKTLDRLHEARANIMDIKVALGGKLFTANATYLITYEADAPIE